MSDNNQVEQLRMDQNLIEQKQGKQVYADYEPILCQNPTAVKIISALDYYQAFNLLEVDSAIITDEGEIVWDLNIPYECSNSVMRTLRQEVNSEKGCLDEFSVGFEKPSTHVLQQESYGYLHTILLHRSPRIEEAEDLYLAKFPSNSIDPIKKQEELEAFISGISMGLRSRINKVIGIREVLYENKKRAHNTYANQSLEIFHEGREHFSGLSIFSGLLLARFRFPFDIKAILIKDNGNNCTKISRILKDNYSLTQISTKPFFNFGNGKEIKIIPAQKGERIWFLEISPNHFQAAMRNILKYTESDIEVWNQENIVLKLIDPLGTAFVINAKVSEK